MVRGAGGARGGVPSAGLAFFTQAVNTGCGQASSQVGPFYCPPDENIYIDIEFLEQLQQRFGADGRYAQAYIMAHEFGHHLQTILGVEPQVRQAQQANPSRANDLSVRLELQADCFAGVWGRLADDRGNVTITRAELTQALEAAAVGDDRIQEAATGRVDPESFTHGSSQQRQEWYTRASTPATSSNATPSSDSKLSVSRPARCHTCPARGRAAMKSGASR